MLIFILLLSKASYKRPSFITASSIAFMNGQSIQVTKRDKREKTDQQSTPNKVSVYENEQVQYHLRLVDILI